jgi:hypothetical protein
VRVFAGAQDVLTKEGRKKNENIFNPMFIPDGLKKYF